MMLSLLLVTSFVLGSTGGGETMKWSPMAPTKWSAMMGELKGSKMMPGMGMVPAKRAMSWEETLANAKARGAGFQHNYGKTAKSLDESLRVAAALLAKFKEQNAMTGPRFMKEEGSIPHKPFRNCFFSPIACALNGIPGA